MTVPRPMKALKRLGFPFTPPPVPASVVPPAKKPTSGVDFETDWARRPVARAVRRVLHETVVETAVRLVADPVVRGLDRLTDLDPDTPVIFTANHHSHVDTPLLLRRLPSPWQDKVFVAAAADYFFPNRVAGIVSALGLNAIPLERTKVSRRSALAAAELIDDGWSMLIYPEGGRSPDGWGQEFRGGAAYLAAKCNVPVVPVHVSGTDKILPKGKNLPSIGTTRLTFGAPLHAGEREDARKMAARIEHAVAVLADEDETDWWQARKRAYRGDTPSLAGPNAVAWRRAWAKSATTGRGGQPRRWPEL